MISNNMEEDSLQSTLEEEEEGEGEASLEAQASHSD